MQIEGHPLFLWPSDPKDQEGQATSKHNSESVDVHVYDSIDPEYAVVGDNTTQKSTSTTFIDDGFCFTECQAYNIPTRTWLLFNSMYMFTFIILLT